MPADETIAAKLCSESLFGAPLLSDNLLKHCQRKRGRLREIAVEEVHITMQLVQFSSYESYLQVPVYS